MGKGRAPCCDKSQVKKGPWSPEEDLKLIAFIQKHGHENWRALPKQAGLLRCGKSCRLRWINYLRPDLKRGNFTAEEEETIIRLHKALGNKWSKISSCLPGRTDNEIKNVWNTHLKKRLLLASKSSDSSSADESKLESSVTSPSSSSSESFFSNNETPKSTINPAGSEITEQASLVKVPEEENDRENSEKKVSDDEPVGIIIEDPKGSSISLSSVESSILNSSQVVEYKTEQQEVLDSALTSFLGPYDVFDATLGAQVVDKQDELVEIPWESDYDFWKLIDNIDLEPFVATCPEGDQVNEALKFGDWISVQDSDETRMMWSNEFENEFAESEKNIELKKDQFPPNDYQAEPGTTIMDQDHAFDLDLMTKPESDELDFGYIQLWPSNWPHSTTTTSP